MVVNRITTMGGRAGGGARSGGGGAGRVSPQVASAQKAFEAARQPYLAAQQKYAQESANMHQMINAGYKPTRVEKQDLANAQKAYTSASKTYQEAKANYESVLGRPLKWNKDTKSYV